MLLDGQSGGPYHDWRATTPVMKQQLESTGLFQVDVVTAPPSSGDFSQFKPDFKKYQVVVSNLDSPEWPSQLMTSFEEYMKEGGGLVVVHAADNAFPKWPAYNLMIGIGGWRGRNQDAGPMWHVKDGKLVSDPAPGNAGSHGSRLPYAMTNQDPNHPVLKGLPKVWMHAADELYATLRGPGENMNVIATAHSGRRTNGPPGRPADDRVRQDRSSTRPWDMMLQLSNAPGSRRRSSVGPSGPRPAGRAEGWPIPDGGQGDVRAN
jgi:hypothetical protein